MTSAEVDGALDRMLTFLSSDTPDESCSLACMESTYRVLNTEIVRTECSNTQQQQMDDLWRVVKMIYNGSTRQEALIAGKPSCIEDMHVSQAYADLLRDLRPKSLTGSFEEMRSRFAVLDASSARLNFNQAQNQVVDQAWKVIEVFGEGVTFRAAVQKVWEERNNAAYRRLLSAQANFIGMYPSGAADAFDRALKCLSLSSPDGECTLQIAESTFRILDSELVRRECSQAQQDVIDDLWRLIKMMYNGASRTEALKARRPEHIRHESAAEMYDRALRFLNPSSAEFSRCTLRDLQAAGDALSHQSVRGEFTCAQNQVVDMLQVSLKGATSDSSVQSSIKEAWDARDNAARKRLALAPDHMISGA